jgi:hypothetical protein
MGAGGVEAEAEAAMVDATGAFLTAGRTEMSPAEQYEFDRLGYLVLRDFLSPEETAVLAAATDRVEEHANAQFGPDGTPAPPHKSAPWGGTYHYDPELGYHTNQVGGPLDGSGANGPSTIVEDYFNSDPRFDLLIDHEKTMAYINTIIQERPTINNSEIRLRYPGNYSGSHQPGGQPSGPPKGKYQFQVSDGKLDCKMVRMIYFVHDVSNEDGGERQQPLPLRLPPYALLARSGCGLTDLSRLSCPVTDPLSLPVRSFHRGAWHSQEQLPAAARLCSVRAGR